MFQIALVYPYFGKFPDFFELWIKSARRNSTIDFFIITDNKVENKKNSNIHFIVTEYKSFQKFALKKLHPYFSIPLCLSEPYKLCDFRPAFGLIFEKLLKKYDFWGYGDLDVILGDIRTFLTDAILSHYEKIYSHGHLTLFRNNKKMKLLFRKNHQYDVYTAKEAFTSPYACHFDEWRGISVIAKEEGVLCYDKIDFADIERREYQFRLSLGDTKPTLQIFEWVNGHLYRLSLQKNQITKQEFLYIHLQKRTMKVSQKISDHFYIIPNYFIPAQKKITEKTLIKYGKRSWWYARRFKIYIDFFNTLIWQGEWKNRVLLWRKKFLKKNGKKVLE